VSLSYQLQNQNEGQQHKFLGPEFSYLCSSIPVAMESERERSAAASHSLALETCAAGQQRVRAGAPDPSDTAFMRGQVHGNSSRSWQFPAIQLFSCSQTNYIVLLSNWFLIV